jgi:16S rRNA (uracil1498-N3)-methyltransferase
MHRFFLPPESIKDQEIRFPPETARQISQVLRLRCGDPVMVLDNSGFQYPVTLRQVNGQAVSGITNGRQPAGGEPETHLTLYIGLTRREKFEWILQKCTEIGVSAYVPLVMERSLIQDPADSASKMPRWRSILREAAEQCGRGRIPSLSEPLRFKTAVESAANIYNLCLIPWEEEKSLGIKVASVCAALPPKPNLAALIGPEGGIGSAEIELARRSGWLTVTLGERILRMETAALVCAALLLL